MSKDTQGLFRSRIKEFRARHDLTQNDLAIIVGIRRETIVHMEKGKYNPSLILAHKIAQALNSTIDELFSFDDRDEQINLIKEHIAKIQKSISKEKNEDKRKKKERELGKFQAILAKQQEFLKAEK